MEILGCDKSHLKLVPPSHLYLLLAVLVKEKCGVELAEDLIVPIVLEFHHLGELQSITGISNMIKILVAAVLHPLPVDPLGFNNWLVLGELHREVPVHVEQSPKPRVPTHLPTFVDRCLTSCVEGGEVSLLGVDHGSLGATPNRSLHLEVF
jgi:hypothetical protein